MTAGVYIVANDRVFDNAIALLSSLRLQDPELPVYMIPFDQTYQELFSILSETFQVKLFPDLEFLETLTQDIANIFPRDFLKLPNKLRKLAVWFGPLTEFVYIDTDILCFQPLQDTLTYLATADFICCDFHAKGKGLGDVFAADMPARNIFTPEQLEDTFNSGFWGSRQGIFTYGELLDVLQECAQNREYFDFSSGTTDQPILNFLVLKTIARRLNITKANLEEPGSWAGSQHFKIQDNILLDGHRKLRYLHWAGTPMGPGGPYWETWQYYRFRETSEPLRTIKAVRKTSPLKRVLNKFLKSG
ncbi:MAG: hypothetical protein VKJ09_15505 [Leptolyngbya sp.]|nr:hypothetical protein [Leptolyngbya sp.]